MNDDPNPFAQWLNATMQNRGLSQAAVAREVGVADAQISRWRRGQVRPTVHYLQRIADTFGVPRVSLDTMAGYPVDEPEERAESAGTDPEREAELQAYQARLRQIMERKLPPSLWPAYADACEALADELASTFLRVVERTRGRNERTIGFHLKD